MSKIITVYSHRGGTGKSEAVSVMAALAARAGQRVALVDMALQSPCLHLLFDLRLDDRSATLYSYVHGLHEIEDAAYDVTGSVTTSGNGMLLLVPSVAAGVGPLDVLTRGYDLGLLTDACVRLVALLELDLLFIDTHPGITPEATLAVALADTEVLVVRPDAVLAGRLADLTDLTGRTGRNNRLLVINMVPPGVDAARLGEWVGLELGEPPAAVIPYLDELAHYDHPRSIDWKLSLDLFAGPLVPLVDALVADGPRPDPVEARPGDGAG